MKIHWRPTRRMLSRYLDGELTSSESDFVKEHLGRCETCLSEYRKLRAAGEAVRSLPQLSPSRAFRFPLENRETTFSSYAAGSRGRVRRTLRWAYVVLPLLVLLAVAPNLVKRALLPVSQRDSSALQDANSFTLHLGMFLEGVARDPRKLEVFDQFHEPESVTLEEARGRVSFDFQAPETLPGGFSLAGVDLLQGRLVRLRYEARDDRIDVFQQPAGYPVDFGELAASEDLRGCTTWQCGRYRCYYRRGEATDLALVCDEPSEMALAMLEVF